MPNWKKVITSGSTAVLNEITSSGGIFSAEDIYSRESKLGRDTYLERDLVLGTEPSEDTTSNTSIQFLSRDKSNGLIKHHTLGSNAFSSTTIPTVYNCTLTVQGTGALGGSGTFTANSFCDCTISISHDDTSTQSSVDNTGNTVIQDVTLDGYGHVTGLASKTLSIPTVNDANITINAGSSILTLNSTAGGSEIFTTNQGTAEQITIDHATNGSQGSVNNSGNTVIQDVTLDGYGHVTGLASKTLSIPSISGLTSCTGTVTSVTTGNSNTITIGGTATDPTVAANTDTVADGGTNLATGDQIYDHVTSRISGLTSCTGTTTPSNTQTFTNKSGNISQWTNDSGYITDGNTNWNNSYGFTTCTGTTTPSNTQTFTNKSGNISQWTNDSGYTSCTGTVTPSSTNTFTNKSGNISQWTNDSGYTSCTGTVTAASGVDNRVAVFSGASSLNASSNFTYDDGSTLLVTGRIIFGGSNSNAGTCASVLGGGNNCIYSGNDYAVIVGGDTNHNNGRTSFIGAGSNNFVRACANFIGGGYGNSIGNDTSSGASNCSSVIVGGIGNYIDGGTTTTNACHVNFIGGGQSNTIRCTGRSTIAGGVSNCIAGSNGYSVIAGGQTNCIGGQHSFVGGGSANTMNAHYSTLGGGASNCIQGGSYNLLGGGQSNIITGCTHNTIAGGSSNEVVVTSYGNSNFIGGGIQNKICGTNNSYATVTGGWCNSICSSYCSTIGGGRSNCVTSQNLSTIGGGGSNYVCGRASTITGGENNCICNNTCGCASILGGCNNRICTAKFASAVGLSNIVNHDCSHVIGAGLTSTTTRTTYMNNATVACHLQVGGTTTMSTTTGRIDATNDIVAYATSDRRLKENIQPINNALCKVVGVSGNTFIWKELSEQEVKDIHGNTGNDVGVIAQEIESILPEAVTTRDNGYKAVNYEKIVPLLIEAIKEQQKQIDELKSKV